MNLFRNHSCRNTCYIDDYLSRWGKEGIQGYLPPVVTVDERGSLHIPNVQHTYGGVYTCYATNSAGTSESSVTLTVGM